MLTLLSATFASADAFVEIEEWGNENLQFADSVPSPDALNDLVNALDPKVFKACFTSWVATLRDDERDVIAIDGKTSRRTHNRRKGREPLQLVSASWVPCCAWTAARQRLVLGQQAVDETSNEITAVPRFLERLKLTAVLETIDAMGAPSDNGRAIVDRGANYCLARKGNHPTDPMPGSNTSVAEVHDTTMEPCAPQ